jgi:hypothetical protein
MNGSKIVRTDDDDGDRSGFWTEDWLTLPDLFPIFYVVVADRTKHQLHVFAYHISPLVGFSHVSYFMAYFSSSTRKRLPSSLASSDNRPSCLKAPKECTLPAKPNFHLERKLGNGFCQS